MTNIDRHPTLRSVYIAYDATGFAFRVRKMISGDWMASPSHAAASTDYRNFTARTLRAAAGLVQASTRAA